VGKDTKRLQRVLKQEGFDPGAIDGIRGEKTKAAFRLWGDKAQEQPHGIDVSHYQTSIDWQVCKAAGVEFVAIRSSVSLSSDKLFSQHWQGAKTAGILRAAYHYFTPWQDPLKQARLVVSRLGADRGELPVVFDVEAVAPRAKPGQSAPIPVITAQLVQRTGEGLTELERLLGRKPLLYTYASFAYEHNLGKAFPDYSLFLADYREGPPDLLGGYGSYLFHQYAGDAGRQPGVKGPCDLDRFNGTQSQLNALAGR
jgi:lysozyme